MKHLSIFLLILILLLAVVVPTYAGSPLALHGMVANDPPTVNLLSPAWIQTDFDLALLQYDFGETKMVLNMANLAQDPTPADIVALTLHPAYDRWFMVGYNEPDLNGYNAQEAADKIIAQGNLILSVVPNARLTIASLSQYKSLFSAQYFWKIWNKLPANIQNKVRAVNIHFYTQAEQLPDSETFSPQPIISHLDATRASMTEHGIGDKQLFVTEIGLAKTPYTLAHMSDVANYPNVIQTAMNGRADRWALYAQLEWASAENYHGLISSSPYGQITEMGQTFAGMQDLIIEQVRGVLAVDE